MNQFALKSDNNWKAGEAALKAGMLDAAASRFYYALFEAVWGYGESKNLVERDAIDKHAKAAEVVFNAGGANASLCRETYGKLKACRVIADYHPEPLKQGRLTILLQHANQIRQHFIEIA